MSKQKIKPTKVSGNLAIVPAIVFGVVFSAVSSVLLSYVYDALPETIATVMSFTLFVIVTALSFRVFKPLMAGGSEDE